MLRQWAEQPFVGPRSSNWKGGISPAISPEKHACYRVYAAALRYGLLVRPSKCAQCRKSCRPHGHHRDYAKPLEVRWLCAKCHSWHHATERNRAKRQSRSATGDFAEQARLHLQQRAG